MGTKKPPNECACGRPCYGKQCEACRNKTTADLPPEGIERTDEGDFATIRSMSERIRTIEQQMAEAGIDPDIWRVRKQTISVHESPNRDGTRKLWAVRGVYERRISESTEAALRGFIEKIEKAAPKPPRRACRAKSSACLLEFSPADMHFGKYAWAPEAGDNFDLRICRRVFLDAAEAALTHASHRNVSRILFPLGGDFLHSNGSKPETASGTRMDVDGRYHKVMETAIESCIHAIDRFAEVAPVEVLWIRGNHDEDSSFTLARVLQAYYHRDKAIDVDCSPAARKYVQFGCCLLGFTHGDEEKHSSLPTIMATERPEDWAATTHREWHLGHFHKRRATVTTPVDTHDGVTVRVLPSLSGTDAWHYRKGYIGGRKAAEAYLWSAHEGYLGHFSLNADPKLYRGGDAA